MIKKSEECLNSMRMNHHIIKVIYLLILFYILAADCDIRNYSLGTKKRQKLRTHLGIRRKLIQN